MHDRRINSLGIEFLLSAGNIHYAVYRMGAESVWFANVIDNGIGKEA